MPLSPDEEWKLVCRVRDGETEFFRPLIEIHERPIFQMIWRLIGDEALAAELTHECFVKAFQSLKQFRGDSRFGSWLTRIAINTVRTFATSKRGREMKIWEALDDAKPQASGAPTPEARASDRQLVRLVYSSVHELSPKLRDVVRICVLNDRSAAEAAQILGIPEGTVLSRLHRGLKSLINKLKQQGIDG